MKNHKALLVLVIFMGLLIVAGLVAFGYGVMQAASELK
jgi:hypothetical protein